MEHKKELLSIIYNGEEYTLKEFHEKGYEPAFWNIYRQIVKEGIEDDGTYKVRYKDKVLTIREILTRENSLASQLVFPNRIGSLQMLHLPLLWLGAHDGEIRDDFPEFYEALRLFDVLNNRMSSARYALLEGIYILHESAVMWWINGSKAQFWLRTEFLNNAIIWYNNSFDVLLQTLWIGKRIYQSYGGKIEKYDLRTIKNAEEYDSILARCGWKKIVDWQKTNGVTDNCLASLCAFRGSKEFKKVHVWANKLKHRNGIFYVETNDERCFSGRVCDYNPLKLTPEPLPMDDVIDTLVGYHVAMLEQIEWVRAYLKVNKLDRGA